MLDSGLPGDGSGGRGRPGPWLLALGFPGSSGLCRFGSGSRHGGSDRRSSRRLMFLVLTAHTVATVVEDSSRSRSGLHHSRTHESSSHYPAPAPPPSVLHPGFSDPGDCSTQLVRFTRLRLCTPQPRFGNLPRAGYRVLRCASSLKPQNCLFTSNPKGKERSKQRNNNREVLLVLRLHYFCLLRATVEPPLGVTVGAVAVPRG